MKTHDPGERRLRLVQPSLGAESHANPDKVAYRRGLVDGKRYGRRQSGAIGVTVLALAGVALFTYNRVQADTAKVPAGCSVEVLSGQTGWDVSEDIAAYMSSSNPDETLVVQTALSDTDGNPPNIVNDATDIVRISPPYCGAAKEAFGPRYFPLKP